VQACIVQRGTAVYPSINVKSVMPTTETCTIEIPTYRDGNGIGGVRAPCSPGRYNSYWTNDGFSDPGQYYTKATVLVGGSTVLEVNSPVEIL
jgi:hypothetical protein